LIEWDQGPGSQGGAGGTRLEGKIIMIVAHQSSMINGHSDIEYDVSSPSPPSEISTRELSPYLAISIQINDAIVLFILPCQST
jgi:hypothetical protein